ncbi:uncharacterized protein B0T23DRAFT_174302 [Neurospora hispaniola]|uniref:Uncharacterized protein n=1 Tax=Neurospora hispaniola TaxID=588809 RepID=A0AAJ0I663_9PEZI|nr:hypothetical protein B0T23DRAFT_174302 [Neurospora hispaniola]
MTVSSLDSNHARSLSTPVPAGLQFGTGNPPASLQTLSHRRNNLTKTGAFHPEPRNLELIDSNPLRRIALERAYVLQIRFAELLSWDPIVQTKGSIPSTRDDPHTPNKILGPRLVQFPPAPTSTSPAPAHGQHRLAWCQTGSPSSPGPLPPRLSRRTPVLVGGLLFHQFPHSFSSSSYIASFSRRSFLEEKYSSIHLQFSFYSAWLTITDSLLQGSIPLS